MSIRNVTVLGEYIDPPISDIECSLTFSIKASHIEKTKMWRSKDLSAEFFGDFWNNILDLNEVKPTLHFVCAELLENAVYHSTSAEYSITIQLCFKTDQLLVYVKNSDSTNRIGTFKAFISNLLETEDIQQLFLDSVRESKRSGKEKSQLGLITIIKDRGAALGWKLEEGPEVTEVTTLARIPLKKRIFT